MVTLIKDLKEGLNIFLYTYTVNFLETRQWEKCSHSLCSLDSSQRSHGIKNG